MTEQHALANAETAEKLFAQWGPYWDLSKPYLLEKTPINLVRTRFFQALFPTASFVVIVRHPTPVALATYNALLSNGASPDLRVADLIEHWLLCHELFLSDMPFLKRLFLLNYEDFVARPQETLDRIFQFLQLSPHRNTEGIEGSSNDRYLAQWRSMQNDPDQQEDMQQALKYEARVQALGYSLHDWSVCKPLSDRQ